MSQMPKVPCKYGAPMGRAEFGRVPEGRTVRLYRVRLDSGGYDDGGAYWGLGAPLYCAEGEDYRAFVRAPSRAAAARDLDITEHLRRRV